MIDLSFDDKGKIGLDMPEEYKTRIRQAVAQNQHGIYLELLSGVIRGACESIFEELYNESITDETSFDQFGDRIERGGDLKKPVHNGVNFPVLRQNLFNGLRFYGQNDLHEDYVKHLGEAKRRLVPDLELYTVHKEFADSCSFDYLGNLK